MLKKKYFLVSISVSTAAALVELYPLFGRAVDFIMNNMQFHSAPHSLHSSNKIQIRMRIQIPFIHICMYVCRECCIWLQQLA